MHVFVFQTYVFEVVEVVSDPSASSQRWYKLKLRVRDDAKGPVVAVCGINGYLVSSMGQKVCRGSWCGRRSGADVNSL